MERYDYLENVKNDVINYVKEFYTEAELDELLSWEHDVIVEKLYEDDTLDDIVTGNASGSYAFNAYRAEEYLCHNLDLLSEALDEIGFDSKALSKGAEFCDVLVRCYVLDQVISKAVDELESEYAIPLF